MSSSQEHDQRILDAFTKQSQTFARVPAHGSETIAGNIIDATGAGPRDRILDVACGPGVLACAYAARTAHVCGVDIVPAMIDQARARQKEKHLTNMDWQVGSATALPFADHAFDVVVTRYSFHHFLDHAAVLKEMIRVCRPGGRVAVTDVYVSEDPAQADLYNHMEKLRDPSHARALSRAELRTLMEQPELRDIRTAFYILDMELEAQMAASFPKPGDERKIRDIITGDIGQNKLGMDTRRVDGKVYFSYPIVILKGERV